MNIGSLQAEGERIALDLNLYYNGPWMDKESFLGHTLTDTEVTGTTIVCKDLEECRQKLASSRKAFSEYKPEVKSPAQAYPRFITMAEYREQWQPDGWQMLIIGPTSTWREEWGPWEAIRDIVQNCLDEVESYESGWDRTGFWIADQGKGIAVADLLLGPPRLKPDYARGKFGEGMKIAALAMVRAGYPVHVDTREKEIWIIFLEQPTGDHQVAHSLAALWQPQPDKDFRWGTKFNFIGYNGCDYRDRFATNLPPKAVVSRSLAKLVSPLLRHNSLIEYAFPTETCLDSVSGNRIFCRDIYLREISSPFSYNLWGFELAPDRHGPKSEEDLWVDMGRLWASCDTPRLMEIFLQMVGFPPLLATDESTRVSLDRWSLGSTPEGQAYMDIMFSNAGLWQQAWDKVYGANVVLRTLDKLDNMVKHLGYESRRVSWACESALSRVVKTDNILIQESQERLREVEVVPDERLDANSLASLQLARAIVLEHGGHRKVNGTYAALIPPASDRVRTAGMYGTILKDIYINLDQLSYGRSTVDTVIHELAHHTSGAEDLEEPHAAAMTKLASAIIQATSKGDFDSYLRNSDFRW